MANGPVFVIGDQTFPLSKITNTVGRKDRITNIVPDVDLSTIDTDRSVSRKHAEVTYTAGVVSVRDVGSTNGTTVNGQPLSHQVDEALTEGATVTFGGVAALYHAEGAWPEGLVAEWATAEETMVSAPEETMVSAPEETMVYAPPEEGAAAPAAEEGTFMGAAGGIDPEPADTGAPASEPATAEIEAAFEPAAAAEPAAHAEAEAPEAASEPAAEAEPPAPAPEMAPAAADASSSQMVYVACSNHPHLPAIGLCPGCLEPFCVDCLPDRGGEAPQCCNRCAGISYRLAVAQAQG